MSKYIETIPLSQVERIAVARGGGRSLAQVKAASGAALVMNGGFYDFATGKPTNHLKSDGAVLAKAPWGCWGFAWDFGMDIHMEALPAEKRSNYIGGVELLSPMVGPGDKPSYGPELGGKRGRTAVALTGDRLILYCAGDGTADASTPERLREELFKLGAETAVMLDGGGSSQCDFGGGRVIASARKVHNYICVWLKEPEREEKPMSKTVCLDPGHGPGCVNGSPDGTYKEHEFAWDMARRVKAHLERCGVKVVMTRDEKGYPSLAERAAVSNRAGADLFISLHSNAVGKNSLGKDGWCAGAHGLIVYTSAGPANARRNTAARLVLAALRGAGVELKEAAPVYYGWDVLVLTSAPAMLIEHGFHTNRDDAALLRDSAHRARLAESTARGVCGFLGADWTAEREDAPWYARAQKFVTEHGLSDGTRPLEFCTRAEQWEMLRKYDEAQRAGK